MTNIPDTGDWSQPAYPPGVTSEDIDRDFNAVDGDDDAADELRYSVADSDQESEGR